MSYWPATPVLAFARAFMDWMEILLFECQVSAQGFSCAIEMMAKEKFTSNFRSNLMYYKITPKCKGPEMIITK